MISDTQAPLTAGTDPADSWSTAQWKAATRFDATDVGWVMMSIGMAIGAGIVFLPIQVGLMGLWVFLLSAVIGYPGMYLFQRLFINTLAEAGQGLDYPGMIAAWLGRRWGTILGLLYFLMLLIWMFVYATAITRDSASYLHSFGLTRGLWSSSPWYGLVLITALVALASRGERVLFRLSSLLVATKLLIVVALGLFMVSRWNIAHLQAPPAMGLLLKNAVITLPFTLTSILFIQTLSPMVISYRARELSIAVARHKALRAMNIAFGILFVSVFFYAVSFTLAMGHDEAVRAYRQNISALAITAQIFPGSWATYVGLVLNIFAVMTAFFGVYLGFREACQGLLAALLGRWGYASAARSVTARRGIMGLAVVLAWEAIEGNLPVLSFTTASSPIFGVLGCLIPAWLVLKVPALGRYRGPGLWLVIAVGVLLCLSPLLAWW
ncbi:SLC5/6 family protein [Frateuria aurantia]